jgi:phosphoribosylamine---glycine ligase
MNILLIGGGGREHALAYAIAASPLLDRLYCAPGNPGTAECGTNVALDIGDHAAVAQFCRRMKSGWWRSGRRRRWSPASSMI